MLTLMTIASIAFAAPEMIPEKSVDLLGRTAPTFEAQTFDGQAFSLDQLRGKTVVLSFWASWCSPCRLELPALSQLQKERDDVVIYAVNVDKERAPAEKFLRQVAFDLPMVWDNESRAMGQYNVLSMPTMFVVDAQGTVKFSKTGYSREKGLAELIAVLDGLH